MDSVISKIASVVLKQPIRGNDFVDRLHHIATVAILLVFALAAGLQEYVGTPIDCWTPLDFPDGGDSYHQHINSYCWTHELVFPKYQKDSFLVKKSHGMFDLSRPKPLINVGTAFFRWVTLIFIVQACLFKIPNFLWLQLNTSSGADLERIRELGLQAQNAENDYAKKTKFDEIVAFFENHITDYKSYRLRMAGKHSDKVLSVFFCFGKRSGNFLSSFYLLIKVFNVLNAIGNVFLIAVFLDTSYWKYGIVVLNSVMNYGEWHDLYKFPRLLICDFILEGGNVNTTNSPKSQEFQIQCTMTVNLLLEKIFVLEWFWLVFLFFLTLVNLVTWALKIKPPVSTVLFCKSYMNAIESPMITVSKLTTGLHISVTSPEQVYSHKEFIKEYLRSDGVFVLRILELNADKAFVGEVVRHLWERYKAMRSCKNAISKTEGGRCSYSSNNNVSHDGKTDESQSLRDHITSI